VQCRRSTSRSVDSRQPAPFGSGGGRVAALLAIASFINDVDRANLATAGPLIRGQFALSNAQLGLLLSAVLWTYAPAQTPREYASKMLRGAANSPS
jgi:hypothetical protein